MHYLCDGIENMSLRITVCHHSASLVMPNDDPRDGFFYPILILILLNYFINVSTSTLYLGLETNFNSKKTRA